MTSIPTPSEVIEHEQFRDEQRESSEFYEESNVEYQPYQELVVERHQQTVILKISNREVQVCQQEENVFAQFYDEMRQHQVWTLVKSQSPNFPIIQILTIPYSESSEQSESSYIEVDSNQTEKSSNSLSNISQISIPHLKTQSSPFYEQFSEQKLKRY